MGEAKHFPEIYRGVKGISNVFNLTGNRDRQHLCVVCFADRCLPKPGHAGKSRRSGLNKTPLQFAEYELWSRIVW